MSSEAEGASGQVMRQVGHGSGLISKVGVQMRELSGQQFPGEPERLVEIPPAPGASQVKNKSSQIPDRTPEKHEPAVVRTLQPLGVPFEGDPVERRLRSDIPQVSDSGLYLRDSGMHLRFGRFSKRENMQFQPWPLQFENLVENECLGQLRKGF